MTQEMFWPLAYNSWGKEEEQAIGHLIRNGNLTMGAMVEAFEQEFAEAVGSRYAVMVNSGSSANLIAVATMFYCGGDSRPLQPGDEAIVPAIAWATTYSPLHQYGLKLRIVDVDTSLGIDPAELSRALTSKTRLVVGASILGFPAALDKLRNFADAHGLWFLEDNCESFGASLDGKQCGTFGDMGTFSTFFSHHLNTIEGGVVVTDSQELYKTLRKIRSHGWSRANEKTKEYCFEIPGYNVRPTEIAAVAGLVQLRGRYNMQAYRQLNWATFMSAFTDLPQFKSGRFKSQMARPSPMPFGFVVIDTGGPLETGREFWMTRLQEAGIESRMVTGGCITEHPVIAHYNYSRVGGLPNARQAHYDGFFVGNAPVDLSGQIARFMEVLQK